MRDSFEAIRRRIEEKNQDREKAATLARLRQGQFDELRRTWGVIALPVLARLRDVAYPKLHVGELKRHDELGWGIGEGDLSGWANAVEVHLVKQDVLVNMNYLVHQPDAFLKAPTQFSFACYRHVYGDRHGSDQWQWRHVCGGMGGDSAEALAAAIADAMLKHDLP